MVGPDHSVATQCVAGFWRAFLLAAVVVVFGAALFGSGAMRAVGTAALLAGLVLGVIGWVGKVLGGRVGELAGLVALSGLLSSLVRAGWRR
jgi:hypothetical protein